MASGPGFPAPAWLSSPSTGRAPFAQLIDVAPTVLRALGHAVPPSMNGAPLQASRNAAGTARRGRRAGTAEHVRDRAPPQHQRLLLVVGRPGRRGGRTRHVGPRGCPARARPRDLPPSRPTVPADGGHRRRGPPGGDVPRRPGPVGAGGDGAAGPGRGRARRRCGRVRRRVARALAPAPLRPAADRARGDVHDPGRGRAHGIPSGARRPAGLRRDRRRPLHRLRQPQLRAARGQRPDRHRRGGHRARPPRGPRPRTDGHGRDGARRGSPDRRRHRRAGAGPRLRRRARGPARVPAAGHAADADPGHRRPAGGRARPPGCWP